jgi:hypothetical protein
MPRRYNPALEYDYGFGYYDGEVYTSATMKEERGGNWVPFKVFSDTTSQLKQQVKRLERELAKLKEVQFG